MITIFEAIQSLQPTASFSEKDGVITWIDKSVNQPTEAEIQAEVIKLQAEWDSKEYARKRKESYPPATDYLDGVVKGDQAQIDKYVSDCLAVKQRFPK